MLRVLCLLHCGAARFALLTSPQPLLLGTNMVQSGSVRARALMNARSHEAVETLKPAQLLAQVELLQRQLDLAKEALQKFDALSKKLEMNGAALGAPTDGVAPSVAQDVVESTPKPPMMSAAQAATELTAKAAESTADVLARAQAMMTAFEAAAASAAGAGVEAAGAAEAAGSAQPLAPSESAEDVVARAQAMVEAFEQARARKMAVPEEAAAAAAAPEAEAEQETVQPADETVLAPSADLPPIAVVRAQLEALRSGEPQRSFELTSSLARRQCSTAELYSKMLRDTPAYAMLTRGGEYEIRSALATSETSWQCRVRVDGLDFMWQLSRQPDEMLDIGTVVQHRQAGYIDRKSVV